MREPPWSFVTFVDARDDALLAGVRLRDGRIVQPAQLRDFAGLMAAMPHWSELEVWARDADFDHLESIPGARLRSPLLYPAKAICAGANYFAHIKEMMHIDGLHPSYEPFFFLKPPTTTVIGDGEPVLAAPGDAARVDYEAELAVVIGKSGRHIAEQEAHQHIAGYAVANDISHRGLFFRDEPPSPPFKFDWFSHKAVDRSLPIGPGLVPHWLAPDTSNLAVKLWVNGEIKQDSSTSDMVFSVARLIAAASKIMTLEPGDIIATGTPGGVGVARQQFLKPGDLVEIAIEGVGRMSNVVREDTKWR
jgi:2-keto-4-pentenoate hydratase/2-oxohepta-3-ene-1,7-dioic acid hydratase in catechol pathway